MEPFERLQCILRLNPNASVAVYSDGQIVYEKPHVGIRPTEEECEAVLPEVRASMAAKKLVLAEKTTELENNPLADLTFKQADTWIDSNVTNIASAKTALKHIVKLIYART